MDGVDDFDAVAVFKAQIDDREGGRGYLREADRFLHARGHRRLKAALFHRARQSRAKGLIVIDDKERGVLGQVGADGDVVGHGVCFVDASDTRYLRWKTMAGNRSRRLDGAARPARRDPGAVFAPPGPGAIVKRDIGAGPLKKGLGDEKAEAETAGLRFAAARAAPP